MIGRVHPYNSVPMNNKGKDPSGLKTKRAHSRNRLTITTSRHKQKDTEDNNGRVTRRGINVIIRWGIRARVTDGVYVASRVDAIVDEIYVRTIPR